MQVIKNTVSTKEVWEEVLLTDAISPELFHKVPMTYSPEDTQMAFHSNLGSITVLDRMTGFGHRDTETGYRDTEGNFWLASCGRDVRESGAKTVGEAIQWVKDKANTCKPSESDGGVCEE